MKPLSDTRASELAMRIVLMVQSAHATSPNFLMGDVADACRHRPGISRATAYRHVRRAIDVLCISYDPATRTRRVREKIVDGIAEARIIGRIGGTKRRA